MFIFLDQSKKNLENVLFKAIIFIENFDEQKSSDEAHKIMTFEPKTLHKWMKKFTEVLCDPTSQNKIMVENRIKMDQNYQNRNQNESISDKFGQLSNELCSDLKNASNGTSKKREMFQNWKELINMNPKMEALIHISKNGKNILRDDEFIKMTFAQFPKFAEMLKGGYFILFTTIFSMIQPKVLIPN